VKHRRLPFEWKIAQTRNDLCTSLYYISPGFIPEGRCILLAHEHNCTCCTEDVIIEFMSKAWSNENFLILFTIVITLRLLLFRLLHKPTPGLSLSNCWSSDDCKQVREWIVVRTQFALLYPVKLNKHNPKSLSSSRIKSLFKFVIIPPSKHVVFRSTLIVMATLYNSEFDRVHIIFPI
jgi:hypothetical protein